MGVVDELVRGREAFERREWAAAYDRLATLDPAELTVEDLASLGAAAFLVGNREAAVRAAALPRGGAVHAFGWAHLPVVRRRGQWLRAVDRRPP